MIDWDKNPYPNFTRKEMECHHTHKCKMHPEFMAKLQSIREAYGAPMIISSGYRDKSHPDEIHKLKDGEHVYGMAADVLVSGIDALRLLQVLIHQGINRIGINQKGLINERYVHVGIGDSFRLFPPAIWTY